MKTMRKLIALCLFVPALGVAAGASVALEKAHNDITDKASLQRGAQIYMNYCAGCHSLQYERYKGLGAGIGIVDIDSGAPLERVIQQNLNFVTDKVGDPILSAIPKADSEVWFGVAPPDLSLVTRSRGSDWLYTYMKSFYVDPSRPLGVNNVIFADVAMPHVLAGLQGAQKPVYRTITTQDGDHKILDRLELSEQGNLSPQGYDALVTDLVNFLEYVGEPYKTKRIDLGVYVMLFLIVFTLFAYLLKREYWKDVK